MAHQERPGGPAPAPDDTAFAEVYREHAGAIMRYVRRRLGDSAADDATAEVFSRALAGRASGPAADKVLPWLYGIAANVIGDQRRTEVRRLRALERLAAQTPEAAAPPPPSEADPSLARALRRLSSGDREALLLVAWGELSYEETAAALGVPVGTVRSRINRARRQLARRLPGPRGEAPASSTTGEAHG
jgi:RNA polymerase sigma-70 factor (ECF subfamily)